MKKPVNQRVHLDVLKVNILLRALETASTEDRKPRQLAVEAARTSGGRSEVSA